MTFRIVLPAASLMKDMAYLRRNRGMKQIIYDFQKVNILEIPRYKYLIVAMRRFQGTDSFLNNFSDGGWALKARGPSLTNDI